MAHSIFLDASFFVALLNKDDALHRRAVEILRELQEKEFEPITSNFIINEVITVLSLRVNKKAALQFADFAYYKSSLLRVIAVDRRIEERAVSYLEKRKSKNISFCDCTTFAILELMKISHIATFDRDFRIKNAGFKIVS